MTPKEELIKRLGTLTDKAFLKYLMQTGWCMREIVELSITHDWSDIDIEEELKWLKKENIGEDVRAVANEA